MNDDIIAESLNVHEVVVHGVQVVKRFIFDLPIIYKKITGKYTIADNSFHPVIGLFQELVSVSLIGRLKL
jgi:hypothetical protein